MTRLSKGLAAAGIFCVIAGGVVIALSLRYKRALEDRVKEQVVSYLEDRFESRVEFQSLRLHLPRISSVPLFLKTGRGTIVDVDGSGFVFRHKRNLDLPPLFKIPHFRFSVDLGVLLSPQKSVALLKIDGMELTIPPKGRRHPATSSDEPNKGGPISVTIGRTVISNAVLTILPADSNKPPLRFEIANLNLEDAGPASAMKYQATLTNPKPKGLIDSSGVVGPWNADEPGDTNLQGKYIFQHADLAVFSAISGILESTGKFEGTLDRIHVQGEAHVPDFALKRVKQTLPLATQFEAEVDGTNGNTTLKRVSAKLGNTPFSTAGAVIKHEDVGRRAIHLNARMRRGQMVDVLKLAMKGKPFMKGNLDLDAMIAIPPLASKVNEKLILDGNFSVSDASFERDAVQDKVDELSRRGQGQPKNQSIDDVVSNMRGRFHMENQAITFPNVAFDVAGAAVSLTGVCDLDADVVDFHGQLRLDAKVSQTVTGWKHWFAKPLDPIFAKDGAGTLLQIKVSGPTSHPHFGLNRGGGKSKEDQAKD